jgi:DNA-directed RNA polymerase subunit H (RpoH/RPB5)
MDFSWHFAPIHEKLTAIQAKRELKAINVSFDELPLIKYRDAAIQKMVDSGINIKLGDVIRITRDSKTGGKVPYYRKVIY